MIIQSLDDYIFVFLLMCSLVVATIAIPCYGYLHKEWKGLALGCLLQPFVAGILCLLVALGIHFSQDRALREYHDAALVTLNTTDIEKEDTLLRTWYLKPDEECLCEVRTLEMDSTEYDELELYDVVPLDSFTLSVEDHIEVRFDLKTRTATATDFGKPIDITHVNWANVEAYFNGRQ